VVGAFEWIIDLGSNNVELENPGTCSPQPKVFQIEIRNIRYERRETLMDANSIDTKLDGRRKQSPNVL